MTKYVLLMRHAQHETAGPGQPVQRKLSEDGVTQTKAVGERLASVLDDLSRDDELAIRLGPVWRAGSDEVIETSERIINELGGGSASRPEYVKELDPASFQPYRDIGISAALRKRLIDDLSKSSDDNAVLIIGHQPLLSWIAHALTGKAVPLVHSELACIAIEEATLTKRTLGYLRWVLSPSDDKAIKDIRDKIKSKMDTAKLLGGFVTAVLGFLLASLVDQSKMEYLGDYKWAFYVSAALLFAAVGLYFATVYAYDRLLMPRRFWGQRPPPKKVTKRPRWLVWRPPSSASWVLYQNMMHIWFYLFTLATGAVMVGLLFLAFAVFKPCGWFRLLFVVVVAIGSLAFWWYYRHFGPRIGSDD
jgi:phosphohistidine phosphatase SixA